MKNLTGILLTERDCEIVKFINEFGFCEISHINRRFQLKKPRNYQILNRLITAKLIKHERVFYGQPGIYRATPKGAEFSGLPPLAKVPLTNYIHTKVIIDIYLKLMKEHPEATWISERLLKFEQCYDGIGKRGHIADGVLIFPDAREIHIEVELTMKGQRRLEKIIKSYGAQFHINEVWYFCPPKVFNKLKAYEEKFSYVRVIPITDPIDEYRESKH